MDMSRVKFKRTVSLGELAFGKRRKERAARRKKHLREVFKPALRGLLALPRDVILRIFSFPDVPDRVNLGVVHVMFRVAHKEIERVRAPRPASAALLTGSPGGGRDSGARRRAIQGVGGAEGTGSCALAV